jgi:hypothetical protein
LFQIGNQSSPRLLRALYTQWHACLVQTGERGVADAANQKFARGRAAGGSAAKGFLVEAAAIEGARDITAFGGWRFIAAQVKSA